MAVIFQSPTYFRLKRKNMFFLHIREQKAILDLKMEKLSQLRLLMQWNSSSAYNLEQNEKIRIILSGAAVIERPDLYERKKNSSLYNQKSVQTLVNLSPRAKREA